MSDVEKRCYVGEVRAAEVEGEPTKIIGYASVFNSRSELIFGSFREVIKPGAFDDVLGDDVRALFNHDPNFILGRSSAGTLSLSVDDRGLRYEITAPQTQTIRDLVLAPMQRGDISQSSFAFRVARDGERWYQDEDGVVVREITRFSRLLDVSPVTYPAYLEADSAVRSLEQWRSQQAEQEQRSAEARQKQATEKAARERILDLLERP
ncbi:MULTISPECIES: HK97 family phage prohead protease [Cronobacter]|nr:MULTISPECIES: HK97 family phage prohead protease [Cronobacter]ELY2745820.1 HK97 family phage prohead protease [Cronobacter sakazakii]MDT3539717.1 HK97 family phage prohead protease [Cronobacter sakazakii]MDT3625121.1 HK97 family phage prohead protease [Cronobacter sakazakii]NCH04151.1 HK97 family phage prohead protease [Cronobacter dublinensis]